MYKQKNDYQNLRHVLNKHEKKCQAGKANLHKKLQIFYCLHFSQSYEQNISQFHKYLSNCSSILNNETKYSSVKSSIMI